MQSYKIIFCDNSLSSLINFRGDVIRHFAENKVEIILIAPSDIKYTPEFDNIRCIHIKLNWSGTNPMSDCGYFLRLCKIFNREKPDIVFNYTIKPNIYGALAARLTGCKCVDMVAGLGYMFTGSSLVKRLGRSLYKLGLRSAHKVFLLNQSNADKLVNEHFVHPDRAVLLSGGEGVNFERFPYIENRFYTTRFLMVARILYDKGYSEYVEAAAIVKRKYPDIEFGLLGPLDETSPMGVPKSVVEKDIADGKIVYHGVTNDVKSYLAKDGVVVVVSSYHEGLNRSLMEACAMARPCITTDIPGCRETVTHGVNGYLVPMKDSQALADAMLRFISLPQSEKTAMAEASHNIALSKFNVTNVIQEYIKITDSLI